MIIVHGAELFCSFIFLLYADVIFLGIKFYGRCGHADFSITHKVLNGISDVSRTILDSCRF